MWTEPLEFGKLTWPEVARAAGEGRVPIVPIGTLEDHGYHLPIDTDVTLVEAVCRGAAERLPAQTVLLPPIVHGYSPHHMDFPGTVSIRWDTFCRYCTDVALSLVRHGFERVLMVNGHGSNLVLITHDLAFAWALADRVAIMYLGKIIELGPAQTVLTEPLHPYTKSLLAVTPEVGRRRTHEVLTGEPPDPAHIPPVAASTPAVLCCARERQVSRNPAAWERSRLSRSLYLAIEQPATWQRREASELPDPRHGATGPLGPFRATLSASGVSKARNLSLGLLVNKEQDRGIVHLLSSGQLYPLGTAICDHRTKPEFPCVCSSARTRIREFQNTHSPRLRFRALLTQECNFTEPQVRPLCILRTSP